VSFEENLDSLKLALSHPLLFKNLRHSGPHEILKSGSWKSKSNPLRWSLASGDFFETLTTAPVPDLIFYDPFSYKTDSRLWSLECFRKLFSHCENQSTELFTYSASTAVRAGLLGAGFYVAQGVGTGPKSETTIALTPAARHLPYQLLGPTWLERWNRSGAKFPLGIQAHEETHFREKLYSHSQLRVPTESI